MNVEFVVCYVRQSSKDERTGDGSSAVLESSLADVDRDTRLQFEQCAYDCIGKCWPSASHTQRMSYVHLSDC